MVRVRASLEGIWMVFGSEYIPDTLKYVDSSVSYSIRRIYSKKFEHWSCLKSH